MTIDEKIQTLAEANAMLATLSARVDQLDAATKRYNRVCNAILEALEDRYVGAPDSDTLWFGPLMLQLRAAIELSN